MVELTDLHWTDPKYFPKRQDLTSMRGPFTSAKPASIAAIVVAAVASSGCSGLSIRTSSREIFEIQGVGVGSNCDFLPRYDQIFPCDLWKGTSPSPTPAFGVTAGVDMEGVGAIGLASSRPIDRIDGPEVIEVSIDGTLAMFSHRELEPFEISIVATDGSSIDCTVDTSGRIDGEIEFLFCDQSWQAP